MGCNAKKTNKQTNKLIVSAVLSYFGNVLPCTTVNFVRVATNFLPVGPIKVHNVAGNGKLSIYESSLYKRFSRNEFG
jgi:hypothetical protein